MYQINLRILLLFFIVICSCNRARNKETYIDFVLDKNNCDLLGFPLDSSSTFFPVFLFHDTIPAIKTEYGILNTYIIHSKEEYAKFNNLDPSKLKDTFELTHDDFFLNFYSYALYKMHEPILYDHYFEKDIYRMIAFRSFNSPLVVRIEKNKKEINIVIKKLNKNIRYPFMIYKNWADSNIYTTPDVAYFDTTVRKMIILDSIKYDKEYKEIKRYHDSLAKVLNVIDYYLKKDTIINAPLSIWNQIQTMIDSTNFWTARPNIASGYVQIDGSRWILEGHTKLGYQIKAIPSPNFDNNINWNYFDQKQQYARIFKFILKSTNLNNEPQY